MYLPKYNIFSNSNWVNYTETEENKNSFVMLVTFHAETIVYIKQNFTKDYLIWFYTSRRKRLVKDIFRFTRIKYC